MFHRFSSGSAPWNAAFTRRFLRLGLNIAGFFRADLGVGEYDYMGGQRGRPVDVVLSELHQLPMPARSEDRKSVV